MLNMCSICDGATEDEVRQWFASTIDEYGWAIQAVEPGPDNWGWQYTIGLVERFGHPELVVAAGLSRQDEAGLLHHLVHEIEEEGRRFGPGDRISVAGAELRFAAVHPWQVDEAGVLNTWFDHYRAFPEFLPRLSALQVVLPPEFFCEHTGPQPRLDLPEDVLSRTGGNRAARRARARPRDGRRPPRHRPRRHRRHRR
ncbi:MAG: DUF4262 domain-containing protein [Actinomycetota bacterium]